MIQSGRVVRTLGTVFALSGLTFLTSCGGPTGPTPTLAPVVSSIVPSSGPTTGGTAVRIIGSNFSSGATVIIGGVAATDVVVESASAITATSGPRTVAGPVDVTVSVGGRTGTLGSAYTYVVPVSTPPVIVSLTATGTKFFNQPAGYADIGEELDVSVVAQDPDTPVERLTFEWLAEAGAFSGAGASLKWRAPAEVQGPTSVTLTVIVSDIPGQRVSGTTTVRVHSSVKEVGEMAWQFLQDFSNSEIPASQVMRNFSTTGRCEGTYKSELADVEDNRQRFTITNHQIGDPTVSIRFGTKPCSYAPVDGDACASMTALWVSKCKVEVDGCKVGETGRTSGTDYVTAVYEQLQWKLCASFYDRREIFGAKFMR